MQDGVWRTIGIACLMLAVAACGSEPEKAPEPQLPAQPSGSDDAGMAMEPVMEPIDDEPETEPAAEPASPKPVPTPAPKPDSPAAAEPKPKPEPQPEPKPEPTAPAPAPATAPKPEASPKIETPPPAEPDVPPAKPPSSAPAPAPSSGVVDPGGVVAVAAPKPGLEAIGANKCKLCHKVQHASWAESAHAKRQPPLDCEGCHGPGSEYKTMAVMKDPAQARAAGLVDPDRKFCATCHVSGWTDDLLQRTHAHKP